MNNPLRILVKLTDVIHFPLFKPFNLSSPPVTYMSLSVVTCLLQKGLAFISLLSLLSSLSLFFSFFLSFFLYTISILNPLPFPHSITTTSLPSTVSNSNIFLHVLCFSGIQERLDIRTAKSFLPDNPSPNWWSDLPNWYVGKLFLYQSNFLSFSH